MNDKSESKVDNVAQQAASTEHSLPGWVQRWNLISPAVQAIAAVVTAAISLLSLWIAISAADYISKLDAADGAVRSAEGKVQSAERKADSLVTEIARLRDVRDNLMRQGDLAEANSRALGEIVTQQGGQLSLAQAELRTRLDEIMRARSELSSLQRQGESARARLATTERDLATARTRFVKALATKAILLNFERRERQTPLILFDPESFGRGRGSVYVSIAEDGRHVRCDGGAGGRFSEDEAAPEGLAAQFCAYVERRYGVGDEVIYVPHHGVSLRSGVDRDGTNYEDYFIEQFWSLDNALGFAASGLEEQFGEEIELARRELQSFVDGWSPFAHHTMNGPEASSPFWPRSVAPVASKRDEDPSLLLYGIGPRAIRWEVAAPVLGRIPRLTLDALRSGNVHTTDAFDRGLICAAAKYAQGGRYLSDQSVELLCSAPFLLQRLRTDAEGFSIWSEGMSL
ncbi:MAG: hypothetical protein CMN73_02325 [Sphingomonas sp.]|nr:hypothetical protein [Sphingomonas sp.]